LVRFQRSCFVFLPFGNRFFFRNSFFSHFSPHCFKSQRNTRPPFFPSRPFSKLKFVSPRPFSLFLFLFPFLIFFFLPFFPSSFFLIFAFLWAQVSLHAFALVVHVPALFSLKQRFWSFGRFFSSPPSFFSAALLPLFFLPLHVPNA